MSDVVGAVIVEDFIIEGLGRRQFLEGSEGLETLNQVCSALGYKAETFHRGSSLELFLNDNPGCMSSILEWISDMVERNEEWKKALSFDEDGEHYIVTFAGLSVNAKFLNDSGCSTPDTEFHVYKDKTFNSDDEDEIGPFYCRYEDADATFRGKTVKEVAEEIKLCLESDQSVIETGDYEITEVEPKEQGE